MIANKIWAPPEDPLRREKAFLRCPPWARQSISSRTLETLSPQSPATSWEHPNLSNRYPHSQPQSSKPLNLDRLSSKEVATLPFRKTKDHQRSMVKGRNRIILGSTWRCEWRQSRWTTSCYSKTTWMPQGETWPAWEEYRAVWAGRA